MLLHTLNIKSIQTNIIPLSNLNFRTYEVNMNTNAKENLAGI